MGGPDLLSWGFFGVPFTTVTRLLKDMCIYTTVTTTTSLLLYAPRQLHPLYTQR